MYIDDVEDWRRQRSQTRVVADEESITVDDDAFQVGRRMARSSPRREGIRRRVSIDYRHIVKNVKVTPILPASAVLREDEGSRLWTAYTICMAHGRLEQPTTSPRPPRQDVHSIQTRCSKAIMSKGWPKIY